MKTLPLILILFLAGCTMNTSTREYYLTLDDIEDGSTITLRLDFEVLAEVTEHTDQSPNNNVAPELKIPLSIPGL